MDLGYENWDWSARCARQHAPVLRCCRLLRSWLRCVDFWAPRTSRYFCVAFLVLGFGRAVVCGLWVCSLYWVCHWLCPAREHLPTPTVGYTLHATYFTTMHATHTHRANSRPVVYLSVSYLDTKILISREVLAITLSPGLALTHASCVPIAQPSS